MSRKHCPSCIVLGSLILTLAFACSASAEESSILPPCTVGTSEFPEMLISVRDLEMLMGKYFFTCRADLSIIDGVFESETRDEQWAAPLEQKIKMAASGLPGLTFQGQCRSSLCRVDFEAADIEYCYRLLVKMGEKLHPLIRGTPFIVGGVYVPALPRGYREYFYSEVLPARFVADFRRMMRSAAATSSGQ